MRSVFLKEPSALRVAGSHDWSSGNAREAWDSNLQCATLDRP